MLLCFACIHSKCFFPGCWDEHHTPLPLTSPLHQIREGMPSWDIVCSLFLLNTDSSLADVTLVSTSPLPTASGFLMLFLVLISSLCSVPGISLHCEHLQNWTQLTPETFQIPTEISAVLNCLHSFLKFIFVPTIWHLVTWPGLLWASVLHVCNTATLYHWNEDRINILQGSGV